MATERGSFGLESNSLDRRYSVLWVLFVVCWAADLWTTTRFFVVSYAIETNPVTVGFYHLLGIPGVVLAGTGYAIILIGIVRVLPGPLSRAVLGLATLVYGVFALHNIILLSLDESVLGLYWLIILGALLTLMFSYLYSGPDPLPPER